MTASSIPNSKREMQPCPHCAGAGTKPGVHRPLPCIVCNGEKTMHGWECALYKARAGCISTPDERAAVLSACEKAGIQDAQRMRWMIGRLHLYAIADVLTLIADRAIAAPARKHRRQARDTGTKGTTDHAA